MTSRDRTWLITGTSRGLGRAFANAALERGDRVVATMRDPHSAPPFPSRHSEHLLVLEQDVRDPNRADEVVRHAVDRFGQVDVLVNNAGYGLVGAIEELDEVSIQRQFETNLLGPLWNTRAVLSGMRSRGSGEIVQISTVGAVGTMPMFGLYNASKWGLEAFSEAMAAELRDFGIGMTIAELGGFETDWSGTSMQFSENLPAYDELRKATFGIERLPWPAEPEAATGENVEGDPIDAAEALLAHLEKDPADRPLRLLVGDDAPAMVNAALDVRRRDYALDPDFVWPTEEGSGSPG